MRRIDRLLADRDLGCPVAAARLAEMARARDAAHVAMGPIDARTYRDLQLGRILLAQILFGWLP